MSGAKPDGEGARERLQAADEQSLWTKARQEFGQIQDQQEILVAADKILERDLVPWLRDRRATHKMIDFEFRLMHQQKLTVKYGGFSSEVQAQFTEVVTNLHIGKIMISKISSWPKASVVAEALVSIASILRFYVRTTKPDLHLLECIIAISGLIWRLAVIEQWYQSWLDSPTRVSSFPTLAFEEALSVAYFTIIEFRSLAICYLYRSPVIFGIRSMSKQMRWDKQAARIDDSKDKLSKCSIILSGNDLGKQVEGILADQETLAPWESTIEESMIVKLHTYPYCDRKNQIQGSVAGTCEWFCSHPRFQDWKENQQPGLLLLTADSGCGKSVLAKHLVDQIFPNSVKRATFYLFFENSFPNFKAAIRGMIRQLFLHSPDRIHRFQDQINNLGVNLNEPWQAFLAFDAVPQIEYPSHQAFQTMPQETVCIIDGIDECESSECSMLVGAIQRLYLSESKNRCPKILLTSRPNQQLMDQLLELGDRFNHISLCETTDHDVEQISKERDLVIKNCTQELREHNRLSSQSDTQFLLQRQLQASPDRTLLWPTLAINSLKNAPSLSVTDDPKFQSIIPLSVEDCYDSILQKNCCGQKTKEVLTIMTVATRPISTLEMLSLLAMGTNPEFAEFVEDDGTRITHQKMLVDICPEIVSIGSHFNFIHSSMRQFLTSQPFPNSLAPNNILGWKGSISLHSSHKMVAERCIRYLISDRQQTKSGWLLDYASVNWAFHFRSANFEQDHTTVSLATKLCDPESSVFKKWTAKCRIEMPALTGLSDSLTVASYLGLELVVSLLLDSGSTPPNEKDQIDVIALYWASCNGHSVVVMQLLQAGAEVDARVRGDERDETALLGASSSGHSAVVELLLDAHAKIELTNYWDEPSLFAASANGHAAVVKLLLDAGAQVNVRVGRYRRTPLHQASIEGYVHVVRLLLTVNADVNLKDDDDDTPLSSAVARGHWVVVSALLNGGADVDNYCLLHDAIKRRHHITAKLLLAAGAEMDSEGESYYNSLCLAATLGDSAIVEQLLKAGGNIESTRRGETALYSVCSMINPDTVRQLTIIEQLLKAGANTEFTFAGETALHSVCRKGRSDIARQLLAAKANVNARDESGRTPLHLACVSAEVSTVKVLLDAGAYVDAIANIYCYGYVTPLVDVVANTSGTAEARQTIVKMLLDAGAHVDAYWEDYCKENEDCFVNETVGTPLCVAAHNGHEGAAKLLLEANAQIHFYGPGASPLALAIKWGKDAVPTYCMQRERNSPGRISSS